MIASFHGGAISRKSFPKRAKSPHTRKLMAVITLFCKPCASEDYLTWIQYFCKAWQGMKRGFQHCLETRGIKQRGELRSVCGSHSIFCRAFYTWLSAAALFILSPSLYYADMRFISRFMVWDRGILHDILSWEKKITWQVDKDVWFLVWIINNSQFNIYWHTKTLKIYIQSDKMQNG